MQAWITKEASKQFWKNSGNQK